MTNAATILTHPFEHLGPGPYMIVRCREKLHFIPGFAPASGGSCDHCGTGIRWSYTVRCSNGVEFDVGCDCAEKAGMSAKELKDARRAFVRARWDEQSRASKAQADAEERARNLETRGYALTDREFTAAEVEGEVAAKAWMRAARRYDAQYVGEVGKRIRGIELCVERAFTFESNFGYQQTTTIWIMRDRAGNQLVWKTSGGPIVSEPSGNTAGVWRPSREFSGHRMARWFRCDATVKAHSEYKDMRQTELQRLKASVATSDWFVAD